MRQTMAGAGVAPEVQRHQKRAHTQTTMSQHVVLILDQGVRGDEQVMIALEGAVEGGGGGGAFGPASLLP
eukprot:SAG31_NODE_62_length_28678_cov_21.548270_14_plen_70_part_00